MSKIKTLIGVFETVVKRGKFIVLYGANNLGKSTQVELLKQRLMGIGEEVVSFKYPVYDLEPTGPKIDQALREGRRISDWEFQQECVQNRIDNQPTLEDFLNRGCWVIAEDYKGTGIAWGLACDLPIEDLERRNEGLLKENLAILLDGERFTAGVERGHRYEANSDWSLVRGIHLELAGRYGWEVVSANQHRTIVAEHIWDIVLAKFFS